MESIDSTLLREGITTGSCAAAASKAAAMLAIGKQCPDQVEIVAPGEKTFVLDIVRMRNNVCGVIKDAGDDPDLTDGMVITSSISVSKEKGEIIFIAGDGVGTATLPGLKVPTGDPAINPVPRQMITRAVREIIGELGAEVTISVPGGKTRALRTFNPKLGIIGGISILGTSGIVRPMDESSILASLTLELSTYAAANKKILAVTFGNSGEKSLRKALNIKGRCVMQTGNFIGYLLDEAVRLKINKILVCGHPGKLLKVASGSFNTYNRTADGRKEALCTHAALAGIEKDIIQQLYDCTTTDEAIIIIEKNKLDFIWNIVAEVTAKRCSDRSFGEIQVEAVYTDNRGQILGCSKNAQEFAEELENEK